MSLENDLHKISWPTEYKKIEDLIRRDNSTYKFLFIFALALSIFFAFSFPILLFLSIPFSGYIIYAYIQNINKPAYAYLFKIKDKESWSRASTVEYSEPYIQWMYIFKIELTKRYEISAFKHQLSENSNYPKYVIVNSIIYNKYKKEDQAFFIFSPANDLLGYYDEGKIVPLLRTEKLSNGELFSMSNSIPQEESYPPGNGFVKSDD